MSNGLLCTISTINFLPERERERNFHFLRPGFVIDLGRFSRQKIADLNFNLSFSKQRFRIKKNHEQNVPHARASKDGGSFLRFKFIYICIPCARDPLAARYEQPDAAIDFVLAHEPDLHTPFAATPRVTSLRLARPRAHPTPAEIRCYEIHRFDPFYAIYRALMADVSDDLSRREQGIEKSG